MTPEEQASVNRAKAAGNPNARNGKGSTQNGANSAEQADTRTVNTQSGAERLQERLAPAIEAVAQLTEQSLLSGIPIGLNRFASGNFSQQGEQIFDMVTAFQGSLGAVTQQVAYQLVAADDESKKMLPATADAVTVS